jgi:hypothetical protein
MEFYAYKSRIYTHSYLNDSKFSDEPIGTSDKLFFDRKTAAGAIKHAIKLFGPNCTVFTFTDWYRSDSFKRIYPSDEVMQARLMAVRMLRAKS